MELGKRWARCVGRESNPGQLLGRQLCSPLYHQRCTARAAPTRRPRARRSAVSPPPPLPLRRPGAARPRRPVRQQLCAASGATVGRPGRLNRSSPTQLPSPPARTLLGRGAGWGRAVAALLLPGPRLHAAARPPPRARHLWFPARQSPSPTAVGRGHSPAPKGDGTHPPHTRPGSREAVQVCVASQGAHCGSHCGRAAMSPGACGVERRPSLGRGARAPGEEDGQGVAGVEGWRRSRVGRPRWRAEGREEGPLGPGGWTESGASHQKGACGLPVGESNPGLPRDRRGYSPLY